MKKPLLPEKDQFFELFHKAIRKGEKVNLGKRKPFLFPL